MKLTTVTYEIFESDAQWLDDHPGLDFHEIDREIRLDFDDGCSSYVSWCREPEEYCIGVQDRSFFIPPPEVRREMSHSEPWSRILGDEVEISYLDEAHQVLRIRGRRESVYCASLEDGTWGRDVVRISANEPGPSV